jgi:hypothetical protein
MRMDDNELHIAKTFFSIRNNLDSDSNVTWNRLEHPQKQPSQRVSTLDGMHMDDNELHPQKIKYSICDS